MIENEFWKKFLKEFLRDLDAEIFFMWTYEPNNVIFELSFLVNSTFPNEIHQIQSILNNPNKQFHNPIGNEPSKVSGRCIF